MARESTPDDRPIEELEGDAASNADDTTRREAFEQELEERGRSAEGADVGDQMD
jgi:hypothetical protein